MRSQRIKLAIVLGLLLLAPVTLASAYSYYGGDGTTYVIALHWTTVGDVVQGQLSEVYVGSADPYHVKGFSQAFTGTQDGADISFIMAKPSIFTAGTTWTGTVQHDRLILTIPASNGTLSTLKLAAGSTQDYEQAVTGLQNLVAAAAKRHGQQIAVANANQFLEVATEDLSEATTALPHAVDKLRQDVADLKTSVQAMEHDFNQTMRGHYDKLVQDASVTPLSCHDLYATINSDLNARLSRDLYATLGSDWNARVANLVNLTIPGDVSRYEDVANSAYKAIDDIGNGYQRLQAAAAANRSGTPEPEYEEAQLKTLIDVANGKLGNSEQQREALQHEAQSYQSDAEQVYQEGKALFAKAQALVASLTCTPD